MVEKIEFANTGVKVSRMGIGTYYDPWWILSAKVFNRRSGRNDKIKAIQTAIDDGINLIDTAEIYGSEELVGEAIKGYDREELFIASKVWPSHFSESKLNRSCERSLKRMGLKYVDLYQLHFPSRRVSLSETMSAMERLVDKGRSLPWHGRGPGFNSPPVHTVQIRWNMQPCLFILVDEP